MRTLNFMDDRESDHSMLTQNKYTYIHTYIPTAWNGNPIRVLCHPLRPLSSGISLMSLTLSDR